MKNKEEEKMVSKEAVPTNENKEGTILDENWVEDQEDLETPAESQGFFKKNQKTILGVLTAFALFISAYSGYKYLYPEKEAQQLPASKLSFWGKSKAWFSGLSNLQKAATGTGAIATVVGGGFFTKWIVTRFITFFKTKYNSIQANRAAAAQKVKPPAA